jgi:hypothetical protein
VSARYVCASDRRRMMVKAHASLNGIDYLEVLDNDAPPGVPRQRTLLVHFHKPIPAFDAGNVRIEGGVRITPVRVLWAARANQVASPPGTAPDAAFFPALSDAAKVLVIRTDSAGDYSSYELSLAASASDDEPPAGFDPRTSSVSFSFKVECPSRFDCAEVPDCPPAELTEPAIDYLVKDYAGFRRLMLDRISTLAPDLRERNPADVTVAVVELLAYYADHLSYYQDAVGTEAYLATARKRVSLRRHARMLDYRLGEGSNARTWVCFAAAADGSGDGVLPAGTKVLSLDPEDPAPSPTVDPGALEALLAAGDRLVFETMRDVRVRRAHNALDFYTWDEDECCLPAGATAATLRRPAGFALAPGDLLLLEEARDPLTGVAGDADPARRHVVLLTRVTTRTPGGTSLQDPLDGTPIAEVAWEADDALPFPLCISARDEGKTLRTVGVARGNVAPADHGLTYAGEDLIPRAAPENARYRPRVARGPLTFRTPAGKGGSAAAMMRGGGAPEPAISLREDDGTLWSARPDLVGSDRFATEFVVEMDESGLAQLRFGDGVSGAEPVEASVLRATYRVGNGTRGNVGHSALGQVVVPGKGIERVWNPLPATGGTDPEPAEHARMMAPWAFRTLERAVTAADHVVVAERDPGVQKASARIRWTGSWHTAFVTVDRTGGRAVDPRFDAHLTDFFDGFRMAGRDVEIDGAVHVPLDLALTVCVARGHVAAAVERAVLDVLSARTLPRGRGFFHPDAFTFGQPVYLSRIYEAVLAVPGVEWVDATRFHRWNHDPNGELGLGVLQPGAFEVVRLDNDPSFPENGLIEITTEGGI